MQLKLVCLLLGTLCLVDEARIRRLEDDNVTWSPVRPEANQYHRVDVV